MIIKLIKNELIKQYKKKGILLLTILVLLISLGSPFISKYMSDTAIEDVNMNDTDYTMEFLDEQLADTPSTIAEEIEHLILLARKDNLLTVQEMILVDNDWRAVLIDLHLDATINAKLISAMMDGMTFDDIKAHGNGYDYDLLESLANTSNEDLKKEHDNQISIINDLAEIMISNDYIKGTEIYIDLNNELIELKEDELVELKTKPQDKNTISKIEFTEQLLERLNNENAILQIRIDDSIPYDDYDWKSQTIDSMQFYNNGVYEIVMSEAEFATYGFKDADTYEEYVNILNQKVETRKDNLVELQHSLEVNEPAYNLLIDARSSSYMSMEISLIAINILLIFMGASIMSSEFSKGTIRMLVSRPVKRTSIFFAKVLSLVIVGLMLVFTTTIISTIVSSLLFNFSDFGIDVAISKGGIITSYNYFHFLFNEMVVTLGGMAVIIAMLITLSTITKSAVATLGITMIIYMISAPIAALFIENPLIRNSFIPYMNINLIRLTPDLYNSIWGMGWELNYTTGLISMFALASIITLIGCSVFTKKDIIN